MPSRDDILRLQKSMLPLECEPPEPSHYFAPGMYLRELTIPAGMLIVGKTHKYQHFLIITRGSGRVISEFADREMEAGDIYVSPAWSKRAILAYEDLTMVTVHVNEDDTTDVALIEDRHIVNEHLELERAKIRGLIE